MNFKLTISILLLFVLCKMAVSQIAPFSNKVMISKNGNEMMPFVKGEVLQTTNNDEYYLSSFSKDHVELYKRELPEVISIISSWNKLSPPQGFKVLFYNFIDLWEYNKEFKLMENDSWSLTSAKLEIYFHPYFKGEDGKPVIDKKIKSGAYLYLNNPHIIAGAPLISDIYLCPRKTAEFHGYPIFQTNREEVTIICNKNIPPFILVSQEDYLKTLIANWESRIEKDSQEQQKPGNNQSMKTLQAEKTRRQNEMEKAYQELLKYDKKAAENLKKTFVDVEAMIATEAASPNGNQTGADAAGESIIFEEEIIKLLTTELESLTVLERKKQAFYHVDAMEDYGNQSGLVPNGNLSNGEALVRINKDLVDTDNPNLQLMAISWFVGEKFDIPREYNQGKEGVMLAHYQMAELYKQAAIWKQIFSLVK